MDGLLRHRPGADRRRRGRAVRRRARHLLAARARAVRRRTSSALGKPGTRGARRRRRALRRAARRRASTCSTTTATPGPGEKFADAELLGCPLRLTVGRRTLEAGELEVQVRRGARDAARVPLRGRGRRRSRELWRDAPVEAAPPEPARRLTRGACSGSTAPARRPPETLPGAPLHPWTIPNAIGFVRLALIPVFLVVALSSDDGIDALAGDRCSRSIGWGDYLDGIAARVTGQYSRLGRAAGPGRRPAAGRSRGVVVCWHFELLPRWALAVLVARELFDARCSAATRCAAASSCSINWSGRLARRAGRWARCSSPMAGLRRSARCCSYVGLALALVATVAVRPRRAAASCAAASARPSSSA